MLCPCFLKLLHNVLKMPFPAFNHTSEWQRFDAARQGRRFSVRLTSTSRPGPAADSMVLDQSRYRTCIHAIWTTSCHRSRQQEPAGSLIHASESPQPCSFFCTYITRTEVEFIVSPIAAGTSTYAYLPKTGSDFRLDLGNLSPVSSKNIFQVSCLLGVAQGVLFKSRFNRNCNA